MTTAWPVVLVRYRPRVLGQTARPAYVVPLSTDDRTCSVITVSGAALVVDDIDTVILGEDMPCALCVNHLTSTSPAWKHSGCRDSAEAVGLADGGTCYQAGDWPVILHRDQVG